MHARRLLSQCVTTGLRLGRGTADRLVRLAGPPLGRLADSLVTKVRRPERPTTATFTPSKEDEAAAPPVPQASTSEPDPSPATVARNIGPQRPVPKAERSAGRSAKPRSAPGAKLPPPRPRAT